MTEKELQKEDTETTEKDLAKQAYLAYQDKLNLQVGDTVKVRFSVPSYLGGWEQAWINNMDMAIDQKFKVIGLNCEEGIQVAIGFTRFTFPAFCLEVVSRKSDEKMIKVGDKEFSEATIMSALRDYVKEDK